MHGGFCCSVNWNIFILIIITTVCLWIAWQCCSIFTVNGYCIIWTIKWIIINCWIFCSILIINFSGIRSNLQLSFALISAMINTENIKPIAKMVQPTHPHNIFVQKLDIVPYILVFLIEGHRIDKKSPLCIAKYLDQDNKEEWKATVNYKLYQADPSLSTN